MHLVLVGLPGAGKSTLGPMVARELGMPFVDLDLEIERTVGQSVGEIFATSGEAAFRRLEREATERLKTRSATVVAPGGGWITQPDVVELLCPPGRIIHLRVTPATALLRMGNQVGARPLLMGEDPLSILATLERERAAAYATADAALETESLSLQELVSQTAALASSWRVEIG